MEPLAESLAQDALDECVCFHFRKVTRAVTSYFDHALSPAKVRSGQLVLLLSIRENESPTRNELADKVGLDQSALSRGLQALERQKLVRTVPGRDKRTRLVSLTAKGQRKLNEAYPLWKTAQTHLFRKLGKKRIKETLQEINRINEDLKPLLLE